MNISENGKRLIKNWEALRLQAYWDANHKPTIGYGHLITAAEMHTYAPLPIGHPGNPTLTKAAAEALFDRDVQKFVNEINATLKECGVRLTQNQFDALVAFIFNIGISAWRGSTARRDLCGGKLALVPGEMKRWVHDDHGNVIQGLVNRRDLEIGLFKQAA